MFLIDLKFNLKYEIITAETSTFLKENKSLLEPVGESTRLSVIHQPVRRDQVLAVHVQSL